MLAPVIAEGIPDHDDEFEKRLEDDGRGNSHKEGEADLRRLANGISHDHIRNEDALFERQQEQLLPVFFGLVT